MDNIEIKFKQLIIDKKSKKFNHHHHQCNHYDNNNNRLMNPFGKRKCLKNKKIKSSSMFITNCKQQVKKCLNIDNDNKDDKIDYIDNDNKNNEIKLMKNINDNMIKLWNKNGYRNFDDKISEILDNKINDNNNNNSDDELTTSSLLSQIQQQTCAQQATLYDNCDHTSLVIELAAYLDETLFIPKKMSFMAEMMYT